MGFYISATVRAKEGRADEMFALIDKIVEHVRTREPETVQYQVFRSSQDPNEAVVWEEYTNEAAFEFHKSSGPFQAFAKAIPDMCVGGNADIKPVESRSKYFGDSFKTK